MTQARGSQLIVGFYEEDTYGADPGTPTGVKIYVPSIGVRKSQRLNQSKTLTGNRGLEEPNQGNIDVTGPLPMELNAESMTAILRHLMGGHAVSGTDPYTHTYTVGDLPTSFVLEKDHGSNISGSGRYEKFNGCRIQQAEFNFPNEGIPMANFNIIGSDSSLAATPLDATLTDFGITPFSMFEASINEGGGSIGTVTDARIQIVNGLDTGIYVVGGQGKRRWLPEGKAVISGSLTALFEDNSLLTKATSATETSLDITLSRGDGLGSAGNESMKWTVQQMKYEQTSPVIDGPGGVKTAFNFFGYLSGSNLGLEIVVKNAVAGTGIS